MTAGIEKVEAWRYGDATFPTEGKAIAAAVNKILDNPSIGQKVIDNASALIPLLHRIVELEAAKKNSR